MSTATLQKLKRELKKEDLAIVPRKEYEAFSNWQKMFKTFKPTTKDKATLRQARAVYKAGRTITFNELKHKLAVKD